MTINEFITRENILITPAFVGKKIEPSPKKGEKGWEHFEWAVELKNLQGRQSLGNIYPLPVVPTHSLTYKMGLAHQGFRKWDSNTNKFTNEWRMATEKEIKEESFSNYIKRIKPIPPTVIDILSNVHMNCVDMDNNEPFAEWCRNYGYDDDSIKHKELYERCRQEFFDFRKFFGYKFQEFLECENDY